MATASRTDHLIAQRAARGGYGVTLFAVTAMAAVLVARRAVGFDHQPLSTEELIGVAVIATVAAELARRIWRHIATGVRWADRLSLAAPSFAFCAVAAAVSIPASSTDGLVVLWGAVVLQEIVWRIAERPRPAGGAEQADASADASANAAAAAPAPPTGDAPLAGVEIAEEEAELPRGVSQQWTRSVESGVETVFAQLRAGFAAGEIRSDLHVSFCPPLAARPSIETEQLDGPEVNIKAAQVETFGIHLELQRSGNGEQAAEIVIALYAAAEQRTP
ncbi:MAG: hypothetical protein QGG36_16400 [Pirellulaceae bacterium]|jgi:hypothetical protein|nr:hypothetical protein [Pirellulaceae bacterium]MDP7017387.1 hypothetical protein [Pirellulaceae bacterium]